MWHYNILVYAGIFGAVLTDDNDADGYYKLKSSSIPCKMQY